MPKPKPKDTQVPATWEKFLRALDEQLPRQLSLECLGGFVISALYGLPRPTSDVDFLSVAPRDQFENVRQGLAGQGSPLHKKYGLYLQHVGIVNVPEDDKSRLQEMFPNHYKKLRLFALDPYDLALSELRAQCGCGQRRRKTSCTSSAARSRDSATAIRERDAPQSRECRSRRPDFEIVA